MTTDADGAGDVEMQRGDGGKRMDRPKQTERQASRPPVSGMRQTTRSRVRRQLRAGHWTPVAPLRRGDMLVVHGKAGISPVS